MKAILTHIAMFYQAKLPAVFPVIYGFRASCCGGIGSPVCPFVGINELCTEFDGVSLTDMAKHLSSKRKIIV
jgi:hypothetical protein